MASPTVHRILALVSTTLLGAIGASTYTLYENQNRVLEENEARFDGLEGTLRAHVGIIEESLERLEGKKKGRLVADEEGKPRN